MATDDEFLPQGDEFAGWAVAELIRLNSVIRALEERLAEVAQTADDRLEEIIGVRDQLAGGKAVKIVNRNSFGEISSIEEFTP